QMILQQDTPASPAKSNDQLASPPAYQYQGYSGIPSGSARPTPTPLATTSTPIFINVPNRHRSSACRRFSKAFVLAVLIYLLAGAFFGSLKWGRNIKGGEWQYWGDIDPEWPEYTGSNGNWKIDQDGCSNSWDDSYSLLPTIFDFSGPYHSHTSLTLIPEAVKHLIVG